MGFESYEMLRYPIHALIIKCKKITGGIMKAPMIYLFVAVMIVLAGCAGMTPVNSKLTAEDNEYLIGIIDEEPVFTLSGETANEAWSRAQNFIARYSPMKIQNMSEFVITTYNPINVGKYDHMEPNFGYHVTRLDLRGESEFAVSVSANAHYYEEIATHNMKMLVHYMKNGVLPVHLINKRIDYSKIGQTN